MDNDKVMEGFVISSFIVCGLAIIAWCVRGECKKPPVLRQSPSTENLKDIITSSEDPQQIV